MLVLGGNECETVELLSELITDWFLSLVCYLIGKHSDIKCYDAPCFVNIQNVNASTNSSIKGSTYLQLNTKDGTC